MHPLGLQLAPELQDRDVFRQQVELGLVLAITTTPGTHERCEAVDTAQRPCGGVGRVIGVIRRVVFIIVVVSGIELIGGQQLRQPPQFPDLPLAPLACR